MPAYETEGAFSGLDTMSVSTWSVWACVERIIRCIARDRSGLALLIVYLVDEILTHYDLVHRRIADARMNKIPANRLRLVASSGLAQNSDPACTELRFCTKRRCKCLSYHGFLAPT